MNIHTKTTPRKLATGKSKQTCRVCNADVRDDVHRVFLYGKKSERDGILKCLQEFCEDQRLMHEDDGLSQYICRTCESKILSFVKKKEELKSLFLATESANRRSCEKERFKRCRRQDEDVRVEEESPQALQVVKKTKSAKHLRTKTKITLAPRFNLNPSPKVSLASRFASSVQNTTVNRENVTMESHLTSNVATDSGLTDSEKRSDHSNVPIQPRILPDFLKRKKGCAEIDKKGLDILKDAGIHKVNAFYTCSPGITLYSHKFIYSSSFIL